MIVVKSGKLQDIECPTCNGKEDVIFHNDQISYCEWVYLSSEGHIIGTQGPAFGGPWVSNFKKICYCKECDDIFIASCIE